MSGERVGAVNTGVVGRANGGTVALLACLKCGVLLWDIEAHYAHAHDENTETKETQR